MSDSILDRSELRGQMGKFQLRQNDLAQYLGVSLHSFRLKLNGLRQFTEKEIFLLVNKFGTCILILP